MNGQTNFKMKTYLTKIDDWIYWDEFGPLAMCPNTFKRKMVTWKLIVKN